ncbi:hypothetical protein J2W42_003711 [Rhizobium tibeticum]|uniref:hypothetical protein n=1 Tax=Rhizobium tibeticum TaxID=501024 RepID=UPI00278272DF|nr:hypothetical protein [Rhizobium tibeticum]MDP9810848.1 hypothetical protein [Rhizobium tibeticum]
MNSTAATLEWDRELIRALARHVAEEGPDAEQARQTVKTLVEGALPKTGGILAALRRSPLVGERYPENRGRKILGRVPAERNLIGCAINHCEYLAVDT